MTGYVDVQIIVKEEDEFQVSDLGNRNIVGPFTKSRNTRKMQSWKWRAMMRSILGMLSVRCL